MKVAPTEDNKTIIDQLGQVFTNDKSKNIYAILTSYNVITTTIDFFWQYQLSLVFLTASSFAAAASFFIMIGAIFTIFISLVAPAIHDYFSPETIGLFLPSILFTLSILFFGLILFPNNFALFFTALGFHNVNILLISCGVGAFIDILQKSFRYNMLDVFNYRVWDTVKEDRDELQSTTNIYSNRPTKGIASLLVLALIAISVDKTLLSTAWIMPLFLGAFFCSWFFSVRNLSSSITDDSDKEKPSNVDLNKVLMSGAISVMFVVGAIFLSVLKTTIIISSVGPEALIWLKIFVIPAIFLSHYVVNELKNIFKENNFYVIVIIFNILIISFALVYPYSNFFHLMSFSLSFLPAGLSGALNFWLYSSFYVMAEVWSVISSDYLVNPMNSSIFKGDELKHSVPYISGLTSIGMLATSFCIKELASWGLSTASMLLFFAVVFAITTTVAMVFYHKVQLDINLKGLDCPGNLNITGEQAELGVNSSTKAERFDSTPSYYPQTI